MRWTPQLLYFLAVFLPTLVVIPQQAKAEDEGEPQMVWLDYTEGEVEFSPGHHGAPVLGKDWLQANVGQVMEAGYTLVTEKGRAEIEFEDGTIVYLAENSALQFDQLWIEPEDQMETDVRLLTGTLTIAYSPRPLNEFHLETPVMAMLFAAKETSRIDCALDGVVIKRITGTNDVLSQQGTLTLARASPRHL
jgi:FecR protein